MVDVKIFSRKGAEKDERARTIEGLQVDRLEKNLNDEIRILQDERLKRLCALLEGEELLADLHDEKTNKRLCHQGYASSTATFLSAHDTAQPEAHADREEGSRPCSRRSTRSKR